MPENDPPDKLSSPAGPAGDGPVSGRRGFFAEGFKEVMRPLSKLMDKKLQPVLRAIEQLPAEIEELVPMPLDQPQPGGRETAREVKLPVGGAPVYLRPPGALKAGEFESACSRCGACVEACPAKAIQLDLDGYVGEGYPYVIPRQQACVVCDSLACMHACPSGALRLVDIAQIQMGTAKVDHQTCLRATGEDCRLCVEACPIGEKALDISPQTGRVRVKVMGCVGCGLCERRCPTQPAAIVVVPRLERGEPIVA